MFIVIFWDSIQYTSAAFNTVTSVQFNLHFKRFHTCICLYPRECILFVSTKALRLSNASRRTTTAGEIVNLMAIDAQKLHDVCHYMHEIWTSPISVIVAMFLLWNVIGPSCLAGVAILLVIAPLNGGIFGRLYMKSQVSTRRPDEQTRLDEQTVEYQLPHATYTLKRVTSQILFSFNSCPFS